MFLADSPNGHRPAHVPMPYRDRARTSHISPAGPIRSTRSCRSSPRIFPRCPRARRTEARHRATPAAAVATSLPSAPPLLSPQTSALLCPPFPFPAVSPRPTSTPPPLSGAGPEPPAVDWDALLTRVTAEGAAVPEVGWLTPGEDAAMEALCGSGPDAFLTSRLKNYEKRNDPNETRALSGLSPWIHFGHLSAQRVVLESKKFKKQHSAVRGVGLCFALLCFLPRVCRARTQLARCSLCGRGEAGKPPTRAARGRAASLATGKPLSSAPAPAWLLDRYPPRRHHRLLFPRIRVSVRTPPQAIDSFLEELVVRRELSDNFCHYNEKCAAFLPLSRAACLCLSPAPPHSRSAGLSHRAEAVSASEVSPPIFLQVRPAGGHQRVGARVSQPPPRGQARVPVHTARHCELVPLMITPPPLPRGVALRGAGGLLRAARRPRSSRVALRPVHRHLPKHARPTH